MDIENSAFIKSFKKLSNMVMSVGLWTWKN